MSGLQFRGTVKTWKWVAKSTSHTKHRVAGDELGILLLSENGEVTEKLKHPLQLLQVILQLRSNFATVKI